MNFNSIPNFKWKIKRTISNLTLLIQYLCTYTNKLMPLKEWIKVSSMQINKEIENK